MNKKQIKKFYRIINQPNRTYTPLAHQNNKVFETFTKSLIRQHKFMYIDINEQNGVKVMDQCESSDEEEETQRVGKKFVINLNNVTSRNSKGLLYLHKERQYSEKKERTLNFLKEEIKRSTQRIQNMTKVKPNQSIFRKSIQEGQSLANRSALSRYLNDDQNKNKNKFSINKAKSQKKNYRTIETQKSTKRQSFGQQNYSNTFKLTQLLPNIRRNKRTLKI